MTKHIQHRLPLMLIHAWQTIWLWRENRIWLWVESTLFTLVVIGICSLLNADNPMYLHQFPWPWIASVVVVLQYGLGAGLMSAAFITLLSYYQYLHTDMTYADLQDYLLSGLTLLLICAVFSASWVKRVIRAEEMLVYTNDRLDSLSNSYYMLRLSYDYLEHNVITKPFTLRLLMEELQKLGVQTQGQLTEPLCYQFLQVLAQFCAINSMGIYLYQGKHLSTEAIAHIGNPGPLDTKDPLIQQVMQSGQTHYTALNHLEYANTCQYLVAVPLLANDAHCLGYLVIKDMSFWTLNDQLLTTLSVLVTYFIEEITSVQVSLPFYQAYPDCPSHFAKQLDKLLLLRQRLHMDSVLCAIIVPKSFRIFNVMEQLEKQKRNPDTIWQMNMADEDILLTLIPFSNATGVHGYFKRITDFLSNHVGLTFTDKEIKMRSMQLYHTDATSFITHFIDEFLKPQTSHV